MLFKIQVFHLQNRNRVTDVENKFMFTRGEREGRDKFGDFDQHIHWRRKCNPLQYFSRENPMTV